MALELFVSLTYETITLLDYFFYFIHFSFTLTLVTVSLLLVHQLSSLVDTLGLGSLQTFNAYSQMLTTVV